MELVDIIKLTENTVSAFQTVILSGTQSKQEQNRWH